MQNPRKRNSNILTDLQINKDPFETNRTLTSMLLAARIIAAIKLKGWNKTEFAIQIDKKPSVITRWLSGTHNFTSDTLSDIGLLLNIDLFQLEMKPMDNQECFSRLETYSKYSIGKELIEETLADMTQFIGGKVVSMDNYKKTKSTTKVKAS